MGSPKSTVLKKRPEEPVEIDEYKDGLDESDNERETVITMHYSNLNGKGSPKQSAYQKGRENSMGNRGQSLVDKKRSRIGQFMEQSDNLAKELHRREKTLTEGNASREDDSFFGNAVDEEDDDNLRKYENTE